MLRHTISRVAFAAPVLGLMSAAWAGPADLQGTGAEQQGRANPVSSSASGVSSVVMNPARIGFGPLQQSFALVVSGDRARISLAGRDGSADIGSSIYRSRAADGQPIPHNLATADLPNQRAGRVGLDTEVGLVLGIVVPLWKDRLSAGVVGYLPARTSPSQTYYVDEREAVFSNRLHLSLHEDDRDSQLLAGALALQAQPWLKIGVGLQLLIGASTVASTYLPDTLGELPNQTNLELEVRPNFVPSIGFEARATKNLSATGSLRNSHAARTTGKSRARLWASEDDPRATLEQDIDFAIDWQPTRAALGLSWTEARWDVNAEGVYAAWSQFVDQHNESPERTFQNTVDLGIHGGYRAERWFAFTGFRYSPSPVPKQDGRENHVDSDRFTGGFGGGHGFVWGGEAVEVSLGTQFSRLTSRRETKSDDRILDEYPDAIDFASDAIAESEGLQTNNPGWPGYRVSGWLWASSVTLTWKR